jgi:hypothetical protein
MGGSLWAVPYITIGNRWQGKLLRLPEESPNPAPVPAWDRHSCIQATTETLHRLDSIDDVVLPAHCQKFRHVLRTLSKALMEKEVRTAFRETGVGFPYTFDNNDR